jgi:hypothetical protein
MYKMQFLHWNYFSVKTIWYEREVMRSECDLPADYSDGIIKYVK